MARSSPEDRSANVKNAAKSVRRRYRVSQKPKKLLLGEVPHVTEQVLVLKLAGFTHKQIGSIVGVSRGQVSKLLKNPEVAEKLAWLQTRLSQAALELLQQYTIESVQVLVDVMRSSTDDKMRIQAATEVLDRAGLPKASRLERHSINEDRTTISDDGILERLREASPEVQEKAAQMVEELEKFLGDALTDHAE